MPHRPSTVTLVEGSNLTKLLRLVSYLGSHPASLPAYLSESLNKKVNPLVLQKPWIANAAISFLDDFLSPNHDVIELGGGGSTLFFAKRVRHVLTLESSTEWTNHIETALAEQGISNVTLEHHHLTEDDPQAFAQCDFAQRMLQQDHDVILIDHHETHVQTRPVAFEMAQSIVRLGGIIIVDDSWRYGTLSSMSKAKSRRTFKSTGPCRPGVTTTDIFFY